MIFHKDAMLKLVYYLYTRNQHIKIRKSSLIKKYNLQFYEDL